MWDHGRGLSTILAGTTLLVAMTTLVVANAGAASSLVTFVLKAGDVHGIVPGKVQVFPSVSAVRNGAGERLANSEVRRYESEGFVEAAGVRLYDLDEPAARGISTVFECETAAGARAEMKAESKEECGLRLLKYLVLRHFKVPGVAEAVGFAFLPNRAADELGLEAGVGMGLFTEGNCFFKLGMFRPKSRDVVEPVTSGVRAIFGRPAGTCP